MKLNETLPRIFVDILVEKPACYLPPTLFLPPMCTRFEYLFLRRNPTYTRAKPKALPCHVYDARYTVGEALNLFRFLSVR